jgi:hypothetical protein
MEFIDAASIDLHAATGEVISGSAHRFGRGGVGGWIIFQVPVRSGDAWKLEWNSYQDASPLETRQST